MEIKIKKLNENAKIPEYKTMESAGMDLCASEESSILPMEIKLVPTGLSMEMQQGFEAQIRPRSGLALKGITVLNSPGTIDSDYRGEVKIILMNLGKEEFRIAIGDRIAQMVIAKAEQAKILESKELSDTQRGEGGFGSTGIK